MIISFEGASAIGKTILSHSFSTIYVGVPEVNILFKNEYRSGKFWYYKKQVERFQLALAAPKGAILDGDVFQPIWYNWIYGYPNEFVSKEETLQFYLKKIKEKKIAFPDLYIIFFTSLEELKKRKENDSNRRRRNFKKHIQLIQPHRKYFEFLKKETDISVEFVEYNDVKSTRQKVLNLINNYGYKDTNTLSDFEKITEWLKGNECQI